MLSRRFLALPVAALLALSACQELPTNVPQDIAPAFASSAPAAAFTAEHVVIFEYGVPGDFEARIAALGGSVLRTHPEINVAIVTGLSDDGAATLAASDDVFAAPRDVSVQLIAPLAAPQTVGAPDGGVAGHNPAAAGLFGFQWDMHIIGVQDAWAAGYDDASGVRVAILDSGIDPFHVDMVGRVDAATSAAFVPSLSGPPAWVDDNFHGTHVAGTVATNGIGTSGIAPHATLVAVKVCNFQGSCPFSAIISGLVHAANVNVDVINMSLGGFLNIPAPGGGQLNAALNAAVNYANSRGVLVVSAAGNAAVDLQHIERDFGVNAFRAVPCENGSGMCVSATGPTDLLAGYSNFGRSAINVAAPGGDVAVTGGNPFTGAVLSPCSTRSVLPGLAICAGNGFYLFLQGTSMAAPHVSGAAALLDAQYGGGLNGGQLRASLQNSADDLGKRGADPFYGNGRINVARLLGVN